MILVLLVLFLDLPEVETENLEVKMENLSKNLKEHVVKLSQQIGERNYMNYNNLEDAANYIRSYFRHYEYQVEDLTYWYKNKEYRNVIATKAGTEKHGEIVLVGSHYDSVWGSPGADDNASAVAGLLELVRVFTKGDFSRTIRFVAFTNEEPPFFLTKYMGSRVYANRAKMNGENITAMICLESIGYYSTKPGSQQYPPVIGLFYPNKGNFIAVVGNLKSRNLVRKVKEIFKKNSRFPIESIATTSLVPGINFSDHDSFWRKGYQAVMVTDTAFYKNPHYHCPSDAHEKLDYRSMAEVVKGLYYVILDLVR